MKEALRSSEPIQPEESSEREVKFTGIAENKESRSPIKLMRRSHEQALIAFQLEQLVSEKGAIDASNPEIEKRLDKLPKETAEKFLSIIEGYSIQQQAAMADMWALLEFSEKENEPMTPEYLGKIVFLQRTGSHPNGRVMLHLKEAYFIMVCENSDDYAHAYAGKKENPNFERGKLSAGSYHDYMPLNFNGRYIHTPVLLVKGRDKQSVVDTTIVHERQHFINHRLFDEFNATEKYYYGLEGRNIKDELLAFIRDGTSGNRLINALHGDLYKHLFKNMPEDKRQSVDDIIGKVADFIDSNADFLRSQESRAVLVYQLAGIPLEKIPRWLDAFAEYYGEREKMIDPFYERGIDNDVIGYTFPPQKQVQLALKQIDGLFSKITNVKESAKEIIFSLKNSSPAAKKKLARYSKEYDRLLAEAKKIAKQLKRNSAVMPNADISELYNSEDLDNSQWGEIGEIEFTKKVKAAVLTAVKDFPQVQIDAISEYFCGRTELKPDSLQKLEKIIKDAIKSENGGQSCQVSFDGVGRFDNSFAAAVRFKINEENKERGIKEASFDLFFHSTKFDLFFEKD